MKGTTRRSGKGLIALLVCVCILAVGAFIAYKNVDKLRRVSDRIAELREENVANAAESESVPEPEPTPEQVPAVAVVSGSEAYQPSSAPPPVLTEYEGDIEHIFFHPVVAFPELAFDGDYMSQGFDDWFVTASEFTKVIDALYKKGYILITYEDIVEPDGEGGVKAKTLMLPEGKKPLIISIDDANYYDYMRDNGIVYKLVIDEYGDVAAFTVTPQGEEKVTRDNDIVPLLDDFVLAHPDFSLNNAKAYLALTGYEGVLGYRSQSDSENRESEIAASKPIIERLKQTGWRFASHSYAHNAASKQSYDKLKNDTDKWLDEVGSLLGETNVYIYPFGDVIPANQPDKQQMMKDAGFHVFAGVGPGPYYNYKDGILITQRRHIDGMAFRHQRELNLDMYDSDEIIDLAAREVHGG